MSPDLPRVPPWQVIAGARRAPNERKRLLFLHAALSRHRDVLERYTRLPLLNVLARVADGDAGGAEFEHIRASLGAVNFNSPGLPPSIQYDLRRLIEAVSCDPTADAPTRLPGLDNTAAQAELLRDVFGPYTYTRRGKSWRLSDIVSWRTDAVVALAHGMYESRDFAPMPVLADSLDDAGCDQPDILAHCRGAGPHVRGCWVVDLVRGKA